MNEKELAFEIAQRIILMESQIDAMRRILNRSWNDPKNPWENYVTRGTDQILNLETTHQRCAQIRAAFDAATDGDSLIRTLHSEILQRTPVS